MESVHNPQNIETSIVNMQALENMEKSREELLRAYIDYFADIVELSDDVPGQFVSRKSHKEPLSKAQDNLLVGIRMRLLDLAKPDNGLVLEEKHRKEIEMCAKELHDKFAEMYLLSKELNVSDEVSPLQAAQKLQERKKEQVHILNGLMIKVIRILEAEIRME